ncbi:S-methyl-5-thioribose-1-phosphate isomerase [Longispora sp. NPDC051575]|uniref:S-methyl-5-thioribose-1-phosphate isomerase n=1 Tax=Longispora sp. NPDC051575 TaxID=3154943 RepID=UPI0034128679
MDRTLDWNDGAILAIDQCALPAEYRLIRLDTVDALIAALQRLAIRGAPAIGVAGGLGVALAAFSHPGDEAAVRADAARLADARPTAVNLAWGVRRALAKLPEGPDAVLAEAVAMVDEDERVNRAAGKRAADLLAERYGDRPLRLLTHCNAGALATVAWGTALGAVRELAAAGRVESVLATETRPLRQGARLTVWELAAEGIPYRLCVDSAGPAAIGAGLIDAVIVGADRVAANGDVANKVGTYALACAAARSGVPFLVVAPESTIDADTPTGAGIVIEQRDAAEVTDWMGELATVPGTRVYNPAFDVTPAELVTAVVTELRLYP